MADPSVGVKLALSSNSEVNYLEAVTEATTTNIEIYQRTTKAVPDGTYHHTLILPAADATYGIYVVASEGNDTGTIIVNSPEGTPVVDATLTVDADYVVAFSDGHDWYTLASSTT